jgi:hypothetical protein
MVDEMRRVGKIAQGLRGFMRRASEFADPTRFDERFTVL